MTELLQIQDVRKTFGIRSSFLGRKKDLVAVEGISLRIPKGRTLGLVGESGSGKSTLANMVTGMLAPTSGQVLIDGQPVHDQKGKVALRGESGAQIVFQDPYSSLNPRMPVAQLLAEPLKVAPKVLMPEREQRVNELLDQVGLPRSARQKYPHEFSGGQRQRIVIARALARRPRLLVCDEPVSALDVSVQSQILNLLKDLQDELGLTYLFIGHGLESVGFMSDEIAVMYLGRIVEQGPAHQVLADPVHPYTQALISSSEAIPFHAGGTVELTGEIPSPLNPPSGCVFRTRCPLVTDICAEAVPALTPRSESRMAACHRR
ncbi:ABC transporter ATP-binding protein [Nesterenkonia ebinurensis]|uniref:ABC transporter ATP-binding protein n=1 Tax=Nesterenkonia ebinurensis TaxID=2608252 RepID=UPI00123CBC8A|nr:oligopeptide/dipeptide ABC transporter ATP-binding protein [Nesterenkonia ebinurensis]